LFNTHNALASGDPFSKPVILSKGMFKPIPSKNVFIDTAET